jgi:GNAT superfamily N-acetyltransferase
MADVVWDMPSDLVIRESSRTLSAAHQVEVAKCWMDVANGGGAVGFPFTPVDLETVLEAVLALARGIERGDVILLEARMKESLVGWVTLRPNQSKLTAHWATLARLQSHPTQRGLGIGTALLTAAVEHAQKLGLEQLHLALRGGEGLESFYERHGWVEFGRHRNALRLSSGDDRDEVFMSKLL